MLDWTGEPASVAEQLLLDSLAKQRDRLIEKLAESEPCFDSLLALRAEAVCLKQMAKDVSTEINRHYRPPNGERTGHNGIRTRSIRE